MRWFTSLIFIIIALIAVSFIASNAQDVSLRLFPLSGEITMPLVLLVYGALLVGVVLGLGASALSRMIGKLTRKN